MDPRIIKKIAAAGLIALAVLDTQAQEKFANYRIRRADPPGYGITQTDLRQFNNGELTTTQDANGVTTLHMLAASGQLNKARPQYLTDDILLNTKTKDGRSVAEFAIAHGFPHTLPTSTLAKLNLPHISIDRNGNPTNWERIKEHFRNGHKDADYNTHYSRCYQTGANPPVFWSQQADTPMPYNAMAEIEAKMEAKRPAFVLNITKGQIIAESPKANLQAILPAIISHLQQNGENTDAIVVLDTKHMTLGEVERCRRDNSHVMKIYDSELKQHPISAGELAARFPNLNPYFVADCYANWTPDKFDQLQRMNTAPAPTTAQQPPPQITR